jgi:hypothetical protein
MRVVLDGHDRRGARRATRFLLRRAARLADWSRCRDPAGERRDHARLHAVRLRPGEQFGRCVAAAVREALLGGGAAAGLVHAGKRPGAILAGKAFFRSGRSRAMIDAKRNREPRGDERVAGEQEPGCQPVKTHPELHGRQRMPATIATQAVVGFERQTRQAGRLPHVTGIARWRSRRRARAAHPCRPPARGRSSRDSPAPRASRARLAGRPPRCPGSRPGPGP